MSTDCLLYVDGSTHRPTATLLYSQDTYRGREIRKWFYDQLSYGDCWRSAYERYYSLFYHLRKVHNGIAMLWELVARVPRQLPLGYVPDAPPPAVTANSEGIVKVTRWYVEPKALTHTDYDGRQVTVCIQA